MNVFTSSELASKTKMVCDAARKHGCAFVTTKGKMDLMIVNIADCPTVYDALTLCDNMRSVSSHNNHA